MCQIALGVNACDTLPWCQSLKQANECMCPSICFSKATFYLNNRMLYLHSNN